MSSLPRYTKNTTKKKKRRGGGGGRLPTPNFLNEFSLLKTHPPENLNPPLYWSPETQLLKKPLLKRLSSCEPLSNQFLKVCSPHLKTQFPMEKKLWYTKFLTPPPIKTSKKS